MNNCYTFWEPIGALNDNVLLSNSLLLDDAVLDNPSEESNELKGGGNDIREVKTKVNFEGVINKKMIGRLRSDNEVKINNFEKNVDNNVDNNRDNLTTQDYEDYLFEESIFDSPLSYFDLLCDHDYDDEEEEEEKENEDDDCWDSWKHVEEREKKIEKKHSTEIRSNHTLSNFRNKSDLFKIKSHTTLHHHSDDSADDKHHKPHSNNRFHPHYLHHHIGKYHRKPLSHDVSVFQHSNCKINCLNPSTTTNLSINSSDTSLPSTSPCSTNPSSSTPPSNPPSKHKKKCTTESSEPPTKGSICLWQFLKELLVSPQHKASIRWLDQSAGGLGWILKRSSTMFLFNIIHMYKNT